MSNVDSEAASIVYDPAKAAELLAVSDSGLRRLAPIYETVFGELSRRGKVSKGTDDKRSRVWPSEAVARLQAARAVTGRGRPYRTIEAALEAIRDGVVVDTAELDFGGRQNAADPAIAEALQVLIAEIRLLRDEVQELKQGRELPQAHNPAENKSFDDGGAADKIDSSKNHGLLVRAALWLESVLRR